MPERISFQNQEISKQEQEETSKKEETLELEPLTEKEAEEFNSLWAEYQKAKDSTRYEYRWRIAEKFGERTIPYLIKNYKSLEVSSLRSVDFFDTFATEKTAPMLLEAMKKGKVGIWEAAIGAAAGKEKTAPGLAEILIKLKLRGGSRSNQIKLLDALGEAKIDEVAPRIEEFYKKLRKNKDYAKQVLEHLHKYGNDAYDCDAHDVIKALCRIDGPQAKKAIKKFALLGDEYIKGYAQKALEGQLYIGHSAKHIIEKPVPQTEFYSQKSDSDFEPEKPDPIKIGPTIKQVEQLTSSKAGFYFLEPGQKWQEKYYDYFKDYFNGKLGVFEFLGKIWGNEKIKDWQDFPEGKHSQALQAAISLELLRVLLKAPDLKAMREEMDNLQNHFNGWQENKVSLSNEKASENLRRIFQKCREFLDNFYQNICLFRQEDFRLPESAGGFQLWHEGFKKTRPIRPFTELLQIKLQNYFSQVAFEFLKEGALIYWVGATALRKIPEIFRLYRDVENYDVPIYKEGAQRLKAVAGKRPLVFYGRDADYFYYAVKAQRLGLVDNEKPRKIYINRMIAQELKNPPQSKARERILAYLLQEKVSADALHIDTGFRGSVPETVIRALNPQLSDKEINERIKLLESTTKEREELSKKGGIIDIEGREHKYGSIKDIVRDEKTGKLKVSYYQSNPFGEIDAWVINQVIIRNFAPKQGKKQ